MNNIQGINDMQSTNEGVKGGSEGAQGLRHRVEHARDIVENVRDRAEVLFRDRPYMLPVAAGAVGVGVGMLLGSKITRFILFTAVGTLLSDALGGEIKRISKDFIEDLQSRLDAGEGEGERA